MEKSRQPKLSKSRYLAGLQCQLRLWYECYERDLASEVDAAKQAIFDTGHQVGVLATQRHPGGALIEADHLHHEQALAHTATLLADPSVPALFEAAFLHQDVRIRADILVRQQRGVWDLVEVKSALSVKDINLPDLAVQHWVLRGAGINLRQAGILTLNGDYLYRGGEHDLAALFTFHDLTEEATDRSQEIEANVSEMHEMLRASHPPEIAPGDHCHSPYRCPFYEHCTRDQEIIEHPITDLPSLRGKRKTELTQRGIACIPDIPDDIDLNSMQARVRDAVLCERPYVSKALPQALSEPQYPIHHLDFETFNPAVPRYPGTRPYQVLPFQWSNHIESPDGAIRHEQYLCDGDKDPRPQFAETLLASVGNEGSICIYSRYELGVINELAAALPNLEALLLALKPRSWDLMRVIKTHFYHPDFHGSFSLKSVLPALVPSMRYDALAIQEGAAASRAYLEFILTDDTNRQQQIQEGLLEYCGQDTLAMVELRRALGRVGNPCSSRTGAVL